MVINESGREDEEMMKKISIPYVIKILSPAQNTHSIDDGEHGPVLPFHFTAQ